MRRFRANQGWIVQRQRHRRRRQASAAVELALILPVLCMIAAITIDYSLLFYHMTTITTCAYNGACYASLNPSATNSAVTSAALVDASNLTNPAPTVGAPTFSTDSGGNQYVSVTVSYTYTAHFPWPGLPTSVALTRTVLTAVDPS